MTQLLNDNVYNQIMSSQDEEYIFDKFFPLLSEVCTYIENNCENQILLIRRVFSIIDKIFTMFLTSVEIEDLPEDRKNMVLDVKSSSELVVNKLKNNNVDLKDNELKDSIEIVFEFFNKMESEQNEINKNLNDINKTLCQAEKDFQDTLTINKISNYCKDNLNKPKNELNLDEINSYLDEINIILKKIDPLIIKELFQNFEPPETSKENISRMNAYNSIAIIRVLKHLKYK